MKAKDGWWGCTLLLVVAVAMVTDGKWRRGQQTKWETREEQLLRTLKALLLDRNDEIHDEPASDHYGSPEAGRRWMERTNRELLHWNHRVAVATWDFATNITEETKKKYLSTVTESDKWNERRLNEARKFHVQHFDPDLQRQFQIFKLSSDPRDPVKRRRKTELATTLISTYDTAKVCLTNALSGKQQQQQQQPPRHHHHHHHHQQQQQQNENDSSGCLPLEPDLETKMAESRDPDELRKVWKGWRDVTGRPQRQRYAQFVQLLNEGARDNGFSDFSEYWTQEQFMGNTDLEAMASELWSELRPLYLELHAYVRGRLREHYGVGVVGTDGTIPAHLLGNMWGQTWTNIFSLVTPFPELGQASKDADKLLKNKYDVHDLFKLSEEFYVSMGLFNMTDTFWAKSMLEKPVNREVQCHASASDLYSPGDFRIKMCTSMTMEYLETIHHEMGHVEYFMAYAGQPVVYRNAPNQGFHEAIGDTTTLAVMSRTHLRKLRLTSRHSDNEAREDINDLMKMALTKIAFLPFSLVVDRWRWQVFRGQTTPDKYNYDWWKLRLDLQGLRSPVPRSEEDFDPAAKMHVASNSPYICYFISNIVQFQFYKTLCQASGHQGPLHLCDFGGSLKAGTLFKNFMALGASQQWQDALEAFTGSRSISAQPILEYFEPLRQWLTLKNKENGEPLGWETATVNWKSLL